MSGRRILAIAENTSTPAVADATDPQGWQLVYTVARHEKAVAAQLQSRGIDNFAPLYKTIHRWHKRSVTLELPLFPSYAFIHLNGSNRRDAGGREIMEAFCRDRQLNISPAYPKPGFGFGGSCLPKDLRALLHSAKQREVDCPLLQAVLDSKQQQIQRGIDLVERTGCKRIGVLGLSFKAGTGDIRASAAIPLVETLVGRGYDVCVI
jgi:hypothetical protein